MKALLTGSISSLNTLKDKTIKLVLHLQEMKAEEAANIFSMQNEYAKIYISTDNISSGVQEGIDSTVLESEEKSPSKRMRNVFYRLWEQDNADHESFELFYKWRMNQLIKQIQDKLT